MGSQADQYDYRGTRTSWRRWKRFLKRQTARLRRRLGKRLLDDAPVRVTKGWTS